MYHKAYFPESAVSSFEKAPSLQFFDHEGRPFRPPEGVKALVVYFYPKAMTSGCTVQACAYRKAYSEIQSLGTEVVGVSGDSAKKLAQFREKYELPFTLVSDESGDALQAWGVWVEKSMYGKKYMGIERSTFILAPDGEVLRSWRKVKVPEDLPNVLGALKGLA